MNGSEMTEKDVDLGGVEITESVLISCSREVLAESNCNKGGDDSADAELFKGQANVGANSPALTLAGSEANLTEDDKQKDLLAGDVANVGGNANGSVESKEADSARLEVARGKHSSPALVETVRISNADSSNEVVQKVTLYTSRSRKSKDSIDEDESFEVVEVIGVPGASKQLSSCPDINPLEDVTNDELIAILEGDADSTTAKAGQPRDEGADTIVFEVIEGEDQREKTLNAEEIKQLALEQLRSIPVRKRGRPPNAKQDGGTLISSLVSDWSDNERDPESPPKAATASSSAGSKAPKVAITTAPVRQKPVTGSVTSAAVAPAKQKSTTTISLKKIVKVKEAPVKTEPPKKVAPTVTSMKSSRIIKKKIIWDPDAPETQISYASFIKSPNTPRSRKSSTASSNASLHKRKPDQANETENKEPETIVKPKPVAVVTPKPAPEAAPKSKPLLLSTSAAMQPKVRILNKIKRASLSTAIAVQSKRKRVSEIDRLLNDEGAANMLSTLDAEKPAPKDSRSRKVPTPVTVQADAATAAKKPATPKKRPGRPSAASGWDYVYNQRNEDALIIRRRSNSSYSSTSPRRTSVEAKPVRGAKGKAKSFEFAKPETKKTGKRSLEGGSETIIEDIKKASRPETARKSSRTPTPADAKDPPTKATKSTEAVVAAKEDKNIANITIKRHGSVVQLILKPKIEKIRNSFSVQLMNEVVQHLDVLQADNACQVVLITSAGSNFCQGVDFLALTQGNADKRKSAVQELAGSVTSFLKALLTFPKPLIAGIVGSCSGIGVTMLPVFDAVISSDKSTFEASYAKIGQIPEGNCLVASTNIVRHSFKVKLFWLGEKLTSTEAAVSGLVTQLTAPSKVIEEALQCATHIASLSQQSLIAIKSLKADTKKLLQTLNEEQKILVSQWQTPECQDKFKQYIANETW